MYNINAYNNYIKSNSNITPCEKKEFLNTKRNIFYVNSQTNKQIITYIDKSKNDINKFTRLHMLFNHFLESNFVEQLLHGIKIKRYSDTHIYEYIMKHPEKHAKHKNKDIPCSLYTYTFEKLAHVIYSKYLDKTDHENIKYLDISCGDCHKTVLLGNKLNLLKKNMYGTDIPSWGPYGKDKKNLPINFKLIENNKLDFMDDEFDILTIVFSLHHYKMDDMHLLLDEFKRVLKSTGILIIIEHHVMNDFDHLIIDISHGMNSYLYDKKKDDTYSNYFNWLEFDFILSEHGFVWNDGSSMTGSVGFNVRYDNPYYAIYEIEK